MMRRAAGALAWVTLISAAAAGQSVRGVVLYPDSATRAPGIIVVALDERGDAVGRTLSGPDGTFDLRVPGAGAYGLRLLRIGYRPTVLPAMQVPEGGLGDVRAVLQAQAVALAAVTVRSDNVCGSTQDAGRIIAQLWEEARKALTAAELSAGTRFLDAEWRAFQFTMDRRAARASDQSVLPQRGVTERPFVSASAESLARDGYVVQEDRSWLFRAPDAAALLSDQFAATHCFTVEPPQSLRAHWIGIAFRPTPARSRARDIAGTLWLDRATSELRMLEFRYENLPPEADDPLIGGFVEYAHLATGHWMVARWAIRMPRMARRTIGGAGIPGGGRDDRQVLAAIDVAGGELLRVRRDSADLFVADSSLLASDGGTTTRPARPSNCGAALRAGVTLSGTVSAGGARVDGAAVRVAWRAAASADSVVLATVSDAKGVFILPCVAPGLPLLVTVAAGGARTGPLPLGPLTDRTSLVEIDLRPSPPQSSPAGRWRRGAVAGGRSHIGRIDREV
ncbi:MAG: carboxypeptidase-like regulatory domain-containing protein [Gemmatimonadota bacterium]|nr:carboxypeptidase-like regulatory domain-containing protein [Gemmatimonadota bacterium]